MEQKHLDYFTQPIARRLSPREKVGRCVAISSLALPFVAFGLLAGTIAITGNDPSPFLRLVCVSSMVASCILGLIGLAGIFWWGEKGVWVPAVLGIAFSVAWYVLAKYGAG